MNDDASRGGGGPVLVKVQILSVRRILARRSLVVMVQLPDEAWFGLSLARACGKGERLASRFEVGIFMDGVLEPVVCRAAPDGFAPLPATFSAVPTRPQRSE